VLVEKRNIYVIGDVNNCYCRTRENVARRSISSGFTHSSLTYFKTNGVG